MKKAILGISLGLLLGLSLSPLRHVAAQPPGPPSIAAHHQEQTFTIAPGGSQSFEIPNTQEPVRIEVSFSLLNGATQTPSEIMYAVVNQDEASFRFSWVGTNNDGSQSAGTSIPTGSGPIIARICGGTCAVTNAALEVNSDAALPGTLKLTTNAAVPTATFKVNMWY